LSRELLVGDEERKRAKCKHTDAALSSQRRIFAILFARTEGLKIFKRIHLYYFTYIKLHHTIPYLLVIVAMKSDKASGMMLILRQKFDISGRNNLVESVWNCKKASSARRVKYRLMGWVAHLDRTRRPEIYTRIFCGTYLENTELLGFRTLSIVRILIITRKKNKHDVSETGSVSVLR
jgi:hypothetical protein